MTIEPAQHAVACRVAVVRSSSRPGWEVPWLATDAAEILRVQQHHSFVRWLSGPIYVMLKGGDQT